jgi:hypothetical protein
MGVQATIRVLHQMVKLDGCNVCDAVAFIHPSVHRSPGARRPSFPFSRRMNWDMFFIHDLNGHSYEAANFIPVGVP